MMTFDDMYNGIALTRKRIGELNKSGVISDEEAGLIIATMVEAKSALMEYASLHVEMAPRVLRRGYIHAGGQ